jgi:hypothetical protein
VGFNSCDNCNAPIIWDKKKREQLNTKRPLNRDGTIHNCGDQSQPQQQQQQPKPEPPAGKPYDQQRLDDIKAAQEERKKQHIEFIKNLQWLTKMLAFKAEQDGGGSAEEILNSIGFREYQQEDKFSFQDEVV